MPSFADVTIVNSYITPTYRLTYDQLPEMLAMAGEEEPELLLLADVAEGRRRWRLGQVGAVLMGCITQGLGLKEESFHSNKRDTKMSHVSVLAAVCFVTHPFSLASPPLPFTRAP